MIKRRWHDWIWAYCLLIPWFLGLIFLYVGPMVAALAISLMQWDMITAPRWIGTANYNRMFGDALFYRSLYNTAVYAGVSVPLQLILALLLAVLLNQRIFGVSVYRAIYYLPSVIPTVASTVVWMFLFSGEFGLVNSFLQLFHVPRIYWLSDPQWTKSTLILLSLWAVGQPMVIFLAGLQGVPSSLYDAARVDGANALMQFRHVTLPMITPTILFNLVMGIITSFQVFTQAYVISGGSGDPNASLLFYVMYLYNQAFQYFNMGYASALAWGLFVVVLVLTLLNFVLARRWVFYDEPGGRW